MLRMRLFSRRLLDVLHAALFRCSLCTTVISACESDMMTIGTLRAVSQRLERRWISGSLLATILDVFAIRKPKKD